MPKIRILRDLPAEVGGLNRAMNMKDKLPNLSDAEAMALMRDNGNLIKRPFLITSDAGRVGFKQDEWDELF